jgi:subtilisin family serine protease
MRHSGFVRRCLASRLLLGLFVGSVFLNLAIVIYAQHNAGVRAVDRPVPGRYIVVLRGNDDPLAIGTAVASERGGRLRHVYQHALRGFAIELSAAAAKALVSDPRVLFVEQDGQTSAATSQTAAGWGVDRIDQRAIPLDGEFLPSGDGAGVNVFVLDSGVRISHSEFQGRAYIAGDHVDDDGDGDLNDLENDDDNVSAQDGADCHGHGTHVAATIGGATFGVAKGATLWAHRVLDCSGAGSTSALLAAVDGLTGDDTRRPAVAAVSVSAPASSALDTAVRNSVASGVTYVIAAGNDNVDAVTVSPARVAEAITVAATASNDVRARYSNFGASVDLFAPGDLVGSAGIANDTAVVIASGTSMAAAHVAGAAALDLGKAPDASPSDIRDVLIGSATVGVVTSAGAKSPNRLLYVGVDAAELEDSSPSAEESVEATSLSVAGATTGSFITVTSPNTAVNWGVGSSQRITWAHNLGSTTKVKVEISRNDGATYSVLKSSVQNSTSSGGFKWTVTGPTSTAVRIRVSSTDGQVSDVSDVSFTIANPFVQVTSPNGGESWAPGKTGAVLWNDNLGDLDRVEIRLSTDGGSSYPTVLDSRAVADGSAGFAVQPQWLSNTARIRIAWLRNSNVSDDSDANFKITSTASSNQPPSVSLSAPASGATYTAPATMAVSATASDSDGTIARVDFYQGATLIGSDTSSPYGVTWSNVSAGSYSVTAVATDNNGARTTSAARTVIVNGTTSTSKSVVFTASVDHNTLVQSYLLEIFAATANPATSVPLVTQSLGKPTVVNGDCSADISATYNALGAGSYQLVVAAVGASGTARSTPLAFSK